MLFLQTLQHLIFPPALQLIPLMPITTRPPTGSAKFDPDPAIPTPSPTSCSRPRTKSRWHSPPTAPIRPMTWMHSTTRTALKCTLIGFLTTQCTNFPSTLKMLVNLMSVIGVMHPRDDRKHKRKCAKNSMISVRNENIALFYIITLHNTKTTHWIAPEALLNVKTFGKCWFSPAKWMVGGILCFQNA